MKKTVTKTQGLSSFLAVTAGVGLASSAANGAIQVVDNPIFLRTASAVGAPIAPSTYSAPSPDPLGVLEPGFLSMDFSPGAGDQLGYVDIGVSPPLLTADSLYTFHPTAGSGLDVVRLSVPVGSTIPSFVGVGWFAFGFQPFVDDRTWTAAGPLNTEISWVRVSVTEGPNPTISVDALIYDDTGADVTLAQAVAAAPVPETSGLILLALGSVGLVARRKRGEEWRIGS